MRLLLVFAAIGLALHGCGDKSKPSSEQANTLISAHTTSEDKLTKTHKDTMKLFAEADKKVLTASLTPVVLKKLSDKKSAEKLLTDMDHSEYSHKTKEEKAKIAHAIAATIADNVVTKADADTKKKKGEDDGEEEDEEAQA